MRSGSPPPDIAHAQSVALGVLGLMFYGGGCLY